MNEYQRYIGLSRYARWLPEEARRETWEETVGRYTQFFADRFDSRPRSVMSKTLQELQQEITNLEVMPSMRCLMTAGVALDRDNVAGYNCAYAAVDSPRVFDETMYVLMCGTGVGYSVERQYVNKLPEISEDFHETDTTIVVADSKIGWAKSYRELISMLYSGQIPKWDVSRIRPAGDKLRTFGGRASGPQPLVDLFNFSVEVFKNAAGRKLTSIECHDLMCKVADIVVVGGVRRSALISLSNLTDDRMRHAKSGQWWIEQGQRALANNSVAYTEKPDMPAFMREWLALVESGSGERGIFYRGAAERLVPERRKDADYKDYGCNPCSEIILRSKQFCNLSEVVIRSTDTFEDLKRKVRQATILGTMQATLVGDEEKGFRYLSKKWTDNTKEERLLGVSLTGIMDHPVMSGIREPIYGRLGAGDALSWWQGPKDLRKTLQALKEVAIETNKEWASKLGIPVSAAITCVKPSGTVSQLVDSASGIHTRHSAYYIRTVRADKKDPLAQMMLAQGFPAEDDVTKPDTGLVFSFPVKAPEEAVVRADVNAINQLELWKTYQLHWCEHKPSVTVSVKDDEWLAVGAWVYENFDIMSGVSFLPYSNHTYQQAPYQECSEEEFDAMTARMPQAVAWERLSEFEQDDEAVTGIREYACVSGSCDIV